MTVEVMRCRASLLVYMTVALANNWIKIDASYVICKRERTRNVVAYRATEHSHEVSADDTSGAKEGLHRIQLMLGSPKRSCNR